MISNDLPGVSWSLLIPLLSRARVTLKYNNLLSDPQAIKIVECLSGKFSEDQACRVTNHDLCMAVRARLFDDAIKAFIQKHENATIVNLGAGFDSGFSRNDNGKIVWFDIDLPEVINVRKLFIPETERSHCIARSILDTTWMGNVTPVENGLFIVAGGVLPYFSEQEVKSVIITMAEHFPKCEFLFDAVSRWGRFVSNRLIKKTGLASAPMKWVLNRRNKLNTWHGRISLISHFPLFSNIRHCTDFDKNVTRFIKKAAQQWSVSIVHVKIGN